MDTPHYRHEWKYEITYSDLLSIRQRLRAVAESDPHTVNGKYPPKSCDKKVLSDADSVEFIYKAG